jgi:hypothetical protein
MNRCAMFGIVACLSVGALTGTGRAGSLTYTEVTDASGSLGSQTFTNQQITFTYYGNTAGITNPEPGLFVNQGGTATVNIAGIGTATFTQPVGVFVNQFIPAAGFGDSQAGFDILDISSSAFASYDLSTAYGPIPGDEFGNSSSVSVSTTLGALVITSAAPFGVFNAVTTTAAIPEPGSLTLLGVVAAGLVARASRRRS